MDNNNFNNYNNDSDNSRFQYGNASQYNDVNPYEANANPNTNPYFSDQYITTPYSDLYNNAYNMYGAYGVPVDEMGEPLKNRFGMKLTFSILEMASLFLCNLLAFILGLVACIYTCKANTAYKNNDGMTFKSASKTSTICLWTGFVLSVLTIISLVVSVATGALDFDRLNSSKTQVEKETTDITDNYNQDDSITMDDLLSDLEELEGFEADNSYTSSGDFSPVDLANYYEFTLDGVSLSLPMTVTEFKNVFSLDSDVGTMKIAVDDYELIDYYNADGEYMGYVRVYNIGDVPSSVDEGVILGIVIDATWSDSIPQVQLYNGITFNSTMDEVMTEMPTPGYEYHSESGDYRADYYSWYPLEETGYFDELNIDFWNQELSSIAIYYAGEYGDMMGY